MLIVGGYVTAHCNDKKKLLPVVESVDPKIAQLNTVSADFTAGRR